MATSTRTLSMFSGRRLQPCTVWDSWTADEKQNSYDPCTVRIISGRLAYDVAGKVQDHWTTVLCPVISEYLQRHNRKILKGYAYAWNGRIDCWMMAPDDSSTKLPFVVVTHPDDGVGRRFLSLLKKEPRINASGFTLIRRRGNLTWVTGPTSKFKSRKLRSQIASWNSVEADEYPDSPSDGISDSADDGGRTTSPRIKTITEVFNIGASVFGDAGSIWEPFVTTLGGIVEVGDVPYAMLAAHPFILSTSQYANPRHLPDKEAEDNWILDEDLSDEELSDEDSITTSEQSDAHAIGVESGSSHLLPSDPAIFNDACIFERRLSLRRSTGPYFAERSGRNVGYYSLDFDWVLLNITQHMVNRYSRSETPIIISGITTESHVGERLRVCFLCSSSLMVFSIVVCQGSAIIQPPGSPGPIFAMALDGTCRKGDSGAWVVDDRGRLHGMVVATDPQLNITYAISAQDLFRDMERVTGKPVALPRPSPLIPTQSLDILQPLKPPVSGASQRDPGNESDLSSHLSGEPMLFTGQGSAGHSDALLRQDHSVRQTLSWNDHTGKLNKSSKKRKDPNAPKRGSSAYMFFAMEQLKTVREENPGLSFRQISQVLNNKWKALSDQQREPYEKKAAADRKRYEDEKAKYNAGASDEDEL